MELILIDVSSWLIALGLLIGGVVFSVWAFLYLLDIFIGDKHE
jgi:hypothetical protein